MAAAIFLGRTTSAGRAANAFLSLAFRADHIPCGSTDDQQHNRDNNDVLKHILHFLTYFFKAYSFFNAFSERMHIKVMMAAMARSMRT